MSASDQFEAWAKLARERVEPFVAEVEAQGWNVTTTWFVSGSDPRVQITIRPRPEESITIREAS